ncbi:hypothetical protein [Roseobacter sp.]|uniref:hypothetical protein n=1 Tax=Roseobacter sp. TaxID=1907202 RepID=UPI0025F3E2C9|nr:hypothetical protein [Roseobacter sp.]
MVRAVADGRSLGCIRPGRKSLFEDAFRQCAAQERQTVIARHHSKADMVCRILPDGEGFAVAVPARDRDTFIARQRIVQQVTCTGDYKKSATAGREINTGEPAASRPTRDQVSELRSLLRRVDR